MYVLSTAFVIGSREDAGAAPLPIVQVERTVQAADPVPTSTGLTVRKKQIVAFSATGQWCMSPPACSGPEGYSLPNDEENVDMVLPDVEKGKLIGRAGDGPWFVIGTSKFVTMPSSGVLVLLFNDRTCCYGDNSGSLVVTVRAVEAPPPRP
jgi:hypothetical protein